MSEHDPLELNRAVPGGRVEMFAVRTDDYPGGWFYRFQYYRPGNGEILRYDNAHDDTDLGWHHRHVRSGKTPGSTSTGSLRTRPGSCTRSPNTLPQTTHD